MALLASAAVAIADHGPGGPRPVADARDATGALDLTAASLRQDGVRLELRLSTALPWRLDELVRYPAGGDSAQPFICLELHQRGPSQVCLGPGARHHHNVLALSRPVAGTAPGSRRLIAARISRPSATAVRASFSMRAAGLRAGPVSWALASRSAGPACATSVPPCTDRLPDGGGDLELGLNSPTPTGCTRRGGGLRTHGPRGRKRIAIGFDDGPAADTGRILRVLRRFDSNATFFEVGQETPGRAAIMRRVLESGNELANHSMHHESFPSTGSLAETDRLIRRATGFRPCLFRPPGGAVDGGLIARAAAQRLTTVTWDVDPHDWRNPGAPAIAGNVIGHAGRGSILVMHDGGGPRGQTLAALPAILSHFRRRGFRFVTVTKLLGGRFTYGGGR